eukprot:6466259-Amphidinium_carterae.1
MGGGGAGFPKQNRKDLLLPQASVRDVFSVIETALLRIRCASTRKGKGLQGQATIIYEPYTSLLGHLYSTTMLKDDLANKMRGNS